MTTTEQAIDLVRRYAEVSTTRNLDDLDAIFTSDFSNHSPNGTEHGLDTLKEFLTGVWNAVPDLTVTIDTIFADKPDEGEPWVGALVTLRGTSTDNKQPLVLPEFWLLQISEGKIAERRYLLDRAALQAASD